MLDLIDEFTRCLNLVTGWSDTLKGGSRNRVWLAIDNEQNNAAFS